MTYDAPSPDQLQATIEEGMAAQALMSSTFFGRVIDDLTNSHITGMLAAPVGKSGRVERERHHALQSALTEIVASLMARAASGEQAQRTIQEPVDE